MRKQSLIIFCLAVHLTSNSIGLDAVGLSAATTPAASALFLETAITAPPVWGKTLDGRPPWSVHHKINKLSRRAFVGAFAMGGFGALLHLGTETAAAQAPSLPSPLETAGPKVIAAVQIQLRRLADLENPTEAQHQDLFSKEFWQREASLDKNSSMFAAAAVRDLQAVAGQSVRLEGLRNDQLPPYLKIGMLYRTLVVLGSPRGLSTMPNTRERSREAIDTVVRLVYMEYCQVARWLGEAQARNPHHRAPAPPTEFLLSPHLKAFRPFLPGKGQEWDKIFVALARLWRGGNPDLSFPAALNRLITPYDYVLYSRNYTRSGSNVHYVDGGLFNVERRDPAAKPLLPALKGQRALWWVSVQGARWSSFTNGLDPIGAFLVEGLPNTIALNQTEIEAEALRRDILTSPVPGDLGLAVPPSELKALETIAKFQWADQSREEKRDGIVQELIEHEEWHLVSDQDGVPLVPGLFDWISNAPPAILRFLTDEYRAYLGVIARSEDPLWHLLTFARKLPTDRRLALSDGLVAIQIFMDVLPRLEGIPLPITLENSETVVDWCLSLAQIPDINNLLRRGTEAAFQNRFPLTSAA